MKDIPPGTQVHNVELLPGNGGKLARSAGSSVTLSGYDLDYAILKLSSGETRKVNSRCTATIGVVSNPADTYVIQTDDDELLHLHIDDIMVIANQSAEVDMEDQTLTTGRLPVAP